MKYSLLVLLCFLGVILCDIQGFTVQSLKDSYKQAIPYIKAFYKKTLNLARTTQLSGIVLYNYMLGEDNIEFRIDSGIVHKKNKKIKLSLQGRGYLIKSTFKEYTNFSAKLNNVKYELSYSINAQKLENGKYEVIYRKAGETSFTYDISRVSSKFNGLSDLETQLKNQVNSLNFAPYKDYLKKIAELILETLPNYLK